MTRVDFRKRLFLILSLFALLPAALLTVAWAVAVSRVLPFAAAGAAWDRVAESGEAAVRSLKQAPLSAPQVASLAAHERELQTSVVQAKRLDFLARRFAPVVITLAIGLLLVLWIAASRAAGHLSRQLSRPLHELVGWTELIQRGEQPPATSEARGAPEFETLRQRMRSMAADLATGREHAMEAERLLAFRETARRVAHELKNPLTPMQFAIAQLRRSAHSDQSESIRVLEEETGRLDRMARSFAQFGHLPQGHASDIDVDELLRATATACVPSHIALRFEVAEGIPRLHGFHDTLQRAVMNVVLNAVDACANSGTITIRAKDNGGRLLVEVADTGPGISPERLHHIWQPYVTHKAGGTGLGLAIAEQAVRAHHGQVGAESTVGQGTKIRFDIPYNTPVGASTP